MFNFKMGKPATGNTASMLCPLLWLKARFHQICPLAHHGQIAAPSMHLGHFNNSTFGVAAGVHPRSIVQVGYDAPGCATEAA